MSRMTKDQKMSCVGREFPAADGGNYGIRVVGYDARTDDFIVDNIRWTNGEVLTNRHTLAPFKASYRYKLDEGRDAEVM